MTTEVTRDIAVSATGLLRDFSEFGVLTWADVHPAQHLAFLYGEGDDRVKLALALTVRALRAGSLCVDLAAVVTDGFADETGAVDVPEGVWPPLDEWLDAVRQSPCVTDGDGPTEQPRPFRLVGGLLYLERYYDDQETVRDLLLDRLDQVSIIAGGPGTGKTYRIGLLVAEALSADPRPLIALAAPTGKAAARMTSSLQESAALSAPELSGHAAGLAASTIHRLLGPLPGSRGRFRHNAGNPLPHDLVIIDEMSMVSMTLMARLMEALKPSARLVLVGDPDQLASVEAGSVLADLTTGAKSAALVTRLTEQHRFSGHLSELAEAIRSGDADAALDLLTSSATVRLLAPDDALADLREDTVSQGAAMFDAARAGDADAAVAALHRHRLLAGHRHGEFGVSHWTRTVQGWLTDDVPGFSMDAEFYLGRPVMITTNLADLGLFNGDTGVIVAGPEGAPRAVFETGPGKAYSPYVLSDLQSVHAMTVHKSQGSQFATVSLILPPLDSPLLTRELLYTAVTRAEHDVLVVGTPDAVRSAVERPARRTSGLADRLA
ncbi:exodeoxyribonuclease V subunit alpha [Nigerium massiliense]|uniref:exodeoxyribonuclease V subunit alpha n=1 Tax=Nigerium massiliense TaxID=1522317 RepID=UPI0006943BFC|nr:exodeoxyribonuclease V subunit alpha [Nigerium massiliense]